VKDLHRLPLIEPFNPNLREALKLCRRARRRGLDNLYMAVVEPESVGDVRHLNGWQEFG
jgi:hypothetical protein